MNGKQTVAQMLGEFVREAAVLVAVFAPLDMAIQKTPFTVLSVIAILASVGFLLVLGILIEVARK